MIVTILGLGEAGSILGADLVEMGITVNTWDPKPKCVPPGVNLATSDYVAINGADLILSVNLASVAADVARSSLAALTPGQSTGRCGDSG
jgi:3-hydroxyisobutyrate dehydrogenase-like beta-hydroxyacid dehydrogenase